MKIKIHRWAAVFICMFCGSVAMAGSARLVRDINDHWIPINSSPTDFVDLGATSFFGASDGIHGIQPWSTDGTAAGTVQWNGMRDLGATGRQPVRVGTKVYVLDYPDNTLQGADFWIFDTTTRTAQRLAFTSRDSNAINAGALGALGNQFVATAYNRSTGARELWITDGTDAGTRKVSSANGARYSVSSSVIVGNKIYFLSLTEQDTFEPWVSDGTTAGTMRLVSPATERSDNASADIVAVGNYVFLSLTTADAGSELWRVDVGNDSVARVRDIAPGAAPGLISSWLISSTDSLVIFAASAAGNANLTVWRSDGTTAGTFEIANVEPFPQTDCSARSGNRTTFCVRNISNRHDFWGTDGSIAGTRQLGSEYPLSLKTLGARMYYFNGTQTQVWSTDGTPANTRLVWDNSAAIGEEFLDIVGSDTAFYVRSRSGTPESGHIYMHDANGPLRLTSYTYTNMPSYLQTFAFAQGRLYFDNEDRVHGVELWTSDGTVAGTRMLKNLAPEIRTADSLPTNFASLNGALYFTADDGIHGREVWHSDGSEAGTALLADVNPGLDGSSPEQLFAALGRLFFFAQDAAGESHLYTSTGAAGNIEAIADLVPHSGSCAYPVLMGYVYFVAEAPTGGLALFKSDGTRNGTTVVMSPELSDDGSFDACGLTAIGSRLYFKGYDSTAGEEPWTSDGTTSGTRRLADLRPNVIGSSPQSFTALGANTYFVAHDGSTPRLWVSDGTAQGTRLVTISDTPPILQMRIHGVASNRLIVSISYFDSNRGQIMHRLWGVDATTATLLTIDSSVFEPDRVAVVRDRIYFNGLYLNGQNVDIEPWISDGTPAGTRLLANTNANGIAQSRSFIDFNGVVLFDTLEGPAQFSWRTDGTTAGTRKLGPQPSFEDRLVAGQNLFYSGNGDASGQELFAIGNDRPIASDDSLSTVAAGGAVSLNLIANDADPDGALNAASVIVVLQPNGGTVAIATGIATYTARADFNGEDSFTYTVSDDQGLVSASATVLVTVTAAVPPPSGGGNGGGGGAGSGGSSSGGGGGGGSTGFFELLLLALLTMSTRAYRRRVTHKGGEFRTIDSCAVIRDFFTGKID